MHTFSTLWNLSTVRFSDVFRRQKKGVLGTNELMNQNHDYPKIQTFNSPKNFHEGSSDKIAYVLKTFEKFLCFEKGIFAKFCL